MPTAHCPRCRTDVLLDVPWWGLYVIEGVLVLALLVLLPLMPIILSEIFLLTPMLCVVLVGAVAGFVELRKPPSCRRCQLEIPRAKARFLGWWR